MTSSEITTQAIKYSLENHFENAQAGEIMRAFEDGAKWHGDIDFDSIESAGYKRCMHNAVSLFESIMFSTSTSVNAIYITEMVKNFKKKLEDMR